MIKTENFDKIEITSIEEFGIWLRENHRQSDSVWLITYKKAEQGRYVSREQVLEELICHGWIDGIRRKLDEKRTMQLISPRKAEHWARSYKEIAARMIDEGRMQEAGFKSIRASKESGQWDFMNDVDDLVIPGDLALALSKYFGARPFFDSINDSSKRFALRWLKLAKTPKTRSGRIEKIALLSSKGEKLPNS